MANETWVSASFDVGFNGTTLLPGLDLIIPAGTTMKRFLIRGTSFTWRFRTDFDNEIYPLTVNFKVTSTGPEYLGREFYRTRRALHHIVTSWRDPVTITDTYIWYGLSADLELEVNQRASFGTANGLGFTMHLETSIFNGGPFPNFPDGRARLEFRALHIT